jgi:hypothetical protein
MATPKSGSRANCRELQRFVAVQFRHHRIGTQRQAFLAAQEADWAARLRLGETESTIRDLENSISIHLATIASWEYILVSPEQTFGFQVHLQEIALNLGLTAYPDFRNWTVVFA